VPELQVPPHKPVTSPEAAAVNALVPLPFAIPVNVATPVPPAAGLSVPDIARVPEVVTGEPVTLKPDGTVSATLVTVPVPVAGVWQLPSPRKNVDELQVPVHVAITSDEAAAVNALVPLPLAIPVNVATPVPPCAASTVGKSPLTIVRSDNAPVVPSGVARKELAVCPVAKLSVRVPVLVIGEPVTLNTDGADNATLLTVPPPAPGGVWQLPSPRINVVLLHVPLNVARMSEDTAAVVT